LRWCAHGLAISATLLAVCAIAVVILRPATLYVVHQVLEHLLR
jgi:hypothetical protein